ncbi:TPA: hypothetical protein N0F65_008968 [Lagenidium giganteum]|uniref:Uncharacterized protein n=1 Tax=Lagenidium giganteum TaxID=4803 RepID=A0AAV2YWV0_9STRA|nr:TPA: hypothetical protein N0F65_008968 [Lagenidium giganteum]
MSTGNAFPFTPTTAQNSVTMLPLVDCFRTVAHTFSPSSFQPILAAKTSRGIYLARFSRALHG